MICFYIGIFDSMTIANIVEYKLAVKGFSPDRRSQFDLLLLYL